MRIEVLPLILMLFFGSMQQITEFKVTPPQEFKLRVKKQLVLRPAKLKIDFMDVIEDSRCPIGVDCIWEGNAKIRLRISKSKGESKTVELNTNVEPTTVKFEDHEIRLLRLEPIPKANEKIKAESYTAFLNINKL